VGAAASARPELTSSLLPAEKLGEPHLLNVEPDIDGNTMIVILLYTRTAVLLEDINACFGVSVTEVPKFMLINRTIWIPFDL
jgi:hypothetical protein